MMKMATGEGSPLRQGAETGSRLVFGGYRGLQQQNSRSILFPEVFRVYGYIWAKEVGQGSHEGPMGVGARPGGRARLPASRLPRSFPDVYSKSPGLLPFQK